MSAMCHDCGTYIDEDVETLCPKCKSEENEDKNISNPNFHVVEIENVQAGNGNISAQTE